MHIDLATVTLLGALQTGLLAVVLLIATRSYTGIAQASLRIRAWALALEASGWVLMGLHGQVSDWLSIVLANGIVLMSYALTVRALRMLLGVPQRHALVIVTGLLCWLAAAWFGVPMPDYRARVLCASVAVLVDFYLLIEPLRHCLRRRGSIAERVLLVTLIIAMSLLLWRMGDLLFSRQPTVDLLQVIGVNVIYVMLTSMQPLFTSIGFLLLYNERMQIDLKCLARIDSLTGVNNRLALVEWIDRLFARAARRDQPFAALMLDADHFKSVNDRFGHSGGDKVLLALVNSIQVTIGAKDVIGRVGGEEFVVLSPDVDLATALALGERMRRAVECAALQIDGHQLDLTVSIGVTVSLPGEYNVEALLQRADAALYAAKRAGRNRVMCAEHVVPSPQVA